MAGTDGRAEGAGGGDGGEAGGGMGGAPWGGAACVLGVDEAGRGPVLGPMVYACAVCPQRELGWLGGLGLADSKVLKEERREQLFELMAGDARVGARAEVLSAAEISAQMLRREKVSLNAMAMESTYALIDGVLAAGCHVTEAYIDTLGDPKAHRERLARRFPGIAFTVETKADAKYPIVSAASVVAKVSRDRAVRDFEFAEAGVSISRELGSGYPADPATKKWLLEHCDPVFGFPNLVRFSWQTAKTIITEHGEEARFVHDEEDEEEAADGKKQQKLRLSMGGSSGPAAEESSGAGRHSFFRARKLQKVTITR